MSDLIIKKNGTDYKLPMLAEHYPADRVYLDGDTSKTVQDALTYRIKSATISGTTDEGGNITVANSIVEIINAHVTNISGSARVITPFCGYGYTYLNFKGLDGTNVIGASVTVEYKYLSTT